MRESTTCLLRQRPTNHWLCDPITLLWVEGFICVEFDVNLRGLAGGEVEHLGGETHGARDLELLVLGGALDLSADLLEVLHVAAGEGDADAVELLTASACKLASLLHGDDVFCLIDETNKNSSIMFCKSYLEGLRSTDTRGQ